MRVYGIEVQRTRVRAGGRPGGRPAGDDGRKRPLDVL